MERSTIWTMGKSTISTGPFSSSQTVNVYQRVNLPKRWFDGTDGEWLTIMRSTAMSSVVFRDSKRSNFREKKRTFWGWQIQRLFFLQRLWPARSYLVVHLVYSSWGENNQVFSTLVWIKTVCSRILGLIPEHILWKKKRDQSTQVLNVDPNQKNTSDFPVTYLHIPISPW